MCGIVGYVGRRAPIPIILDGLSRLEYRGYDSAGVAAVGSSGLRIHKVRGRIDDLSRSMPEMGVVALAIGHTRWATHGEPSVANAHPHTDAERRFALVHNGIIENAGDLRASLSSKGYEFVSATDTEVLVHLMAESGTDDLEEALQYALGQAEGTYAVAAVAAQDQGRIVVARNGSPVVIGISDGEHFVASDAAAIAHYTRHVVYLDDHELAVVGAREFSTRGLETTARRERAATTLSWEPASYELGGFRHFMHKEIHEQPSALARLIASRVDASEARVDLSDLEITENEARALRRVQLLGCGSAYYAGLAGIANFERLAGIPAVASPASEFRYRDMPLEDRTLYVVISQSGETIDTLQATREIQRRGGSVIAVVNAQESAIARAADRRLAIEAGPEISVTSTKSFDSTYLALLLLALDLGTKRDLAEDERQRVVAAIEGLPEDLSMALALEPYLAEIAARYSVVKSAFFIGRLAGYPIALEGSQKLKEVSYIHAEAYPCGELKHGPLALITPQVPTFAVVPEDALLAKNLGTMEEIKARRGPVIAVGHSRDLKQAADEVVLLNERDPSVDPLMLLLPLQLIAYHAALALGLDVDKPRNLAKSVTVE